MLQVASFMRAVLRTLSQCHSHRILHRDIKPGNFMLLNDEYRAPLKAIGKQAMITSACCQSCAVGSSLQICAVGHGKLCCYPVVPTSAKLMISMLPCRFWASSIL